MDAAATNEILKNPRIEEIGLSLSASGDKKKKKFFFEDTTAKQVIFEIVFKVLKHNSIVASKNSISRRSHCLRVLNYNT